MYKIGEQLFNENGNNNPKVLEIDLKIVIGVGGSGVVLRGSRGNPFVIKMAKFDPQVMRRWNQNRIGKKLDGCVDTNYYGATGYTELDDKEDRLLKSIEARNIKLTIDELTEEGVSTSNILIPRRLIIQRIKEEWFMINGKIN